MLRIFSGKNANRESVSQTLGTLISFIPVFNLHEISELIHNKTQKL